MLKKWAEGEFKADSALSLIPALYARSNINAQFIRNLVNRIAVKKYAQRDFTQNKQTKNIRHNQQFKASHFTH